MLFFSGVYYRPYIDEIWTLSSQTLRTRKGKHLVRGIVDRGMGAT